MEADQDASSLQQHGPTPAEPGVAAVNGLHQKEGDAPRLRALGLQARLRGRPRHLARQLAQARQWLPW
eukprot:1806298-Alexandrium_andersonii.AAC.1